MKNSLGIQSLDKSVGRERANLALFLSGKSISLFGSAIYTFVVGLYLLKTTGSGLTFATNLVLYTLPMVFINPFAGVVADRMNKKTVVVGTDLLNGVFLFGVYLLAGKIGLNIYLVYISTLVMTVLAIFFNIAIEAAKPNLVRKERLVKINSLARVIESASYVMGPLIGGVIYVLFDTRLFILINALSFILAAVMEYFIDFQYSLSTNGEEQNEEELIETSRSKIWHQMKEGYQYILSRQYLHALVYIFIALNFFLNFSIIVPLPYLLNTVWKVDSAIYGVVEGGLPVGMIIGALFVSKVMERVSYSKLLKRLCYSIALGVTAFALPLIVGSDTPNQLFILIYYTVLMLWGGLVVAWVDIPISVLLQQIVPSAILGRVISVKLSMVKIIVPISVMLSGYLVNIISPLFLFLIGSFMFMSFTVWFFRSALGREFTKISNNSLAEKEKLAGLEESENKGA